MSDIALSIENLSKKIYCKSFFSVEYEYIIYPMNFHVECGEVLSFLGEKGCGFTSIIHLLVGLRKCTTGKIYVANEDISALSVKEKCQYIGVIFSNPKYSFYSYIRIMKQLDLYLKLHTQYDKKQRRDRIKYCLELVDFPINYIYFYPHMLPKNLLYILSFVKILLLAPKVIIFDDAFLGFDSLFIAQLINIISILRKEMNIAFIIMSSDVPLIEYMSDRIIVLQKGKILQESDFHSLYHSPCNEYVRKLIHL